MSSEERALVQEKIIPYFQEWERNALPNCCVVCGEPDKFCIDKHHPDPKNRPNWTIPLCANCHRIFDHNLIADSALSRLEGRRKWLLEVNRPYAELLIKADIG